MALIPYPTSPGLINRQACASRTEFWLTAKASAGPEVQVSKAVE